MITRLQTFFLKHNKWLFGGLLIVIIVTFVLTIGPQSFFGGPSIADRRDLHFFGYNLGSTGDQQRLFGNSEISASLSPELGIRRDQLADYAYMRAAGLGIADKLGIPHPNPKQVETFIRSRLIFQDPETGEFSTENYNQMLDMFQSNPRFSREAVSRVFREDWRIDRVRKTLGGPGVELPWEQKQNYLSRETTFDVVLARLSYTEFSPDLDPNAEELEEFYDLNPYRYAIDEKIRVKAFLFLPENYLAEVPPPEESALKAYFDRNRFRYENDREQPESEEAGPLPPLTLDDVRERVENEVLREEARKYAVSRSESFTLELWEKGIARDDPAFDQLVESYRAKSESIPPYARNRAPSHRLINRQLLNSMWIFATGSRYFSDIGQIPNGGAVVLVFEELIPERLPPFEEVRTAVETDWRSENRRRLFAEHGDDLRRQLREVIADNGDAFVGKAEALGLAVEVLEPFKGNDIPESIQGSLIWDQSRYLARASLSRMILDSETGIFVYMRDKVEPEVDFESEEFLAFVDEQEDYLSDAKGWSRLREITDRTLGKIFGASPEIF